MGLGASARVRRGFNRAGAALGAAVAVVGLSVVLWTTYEAVEREYQFRIQVSCLKPKLDELAKTLPKDFVFDRIKTMDHGCFGPEATTSHFMVDTISATPWATQRWNIIVGYMPAAVIVAILAATTWLFFIGTGWVFSGFFRD